MKKRILSTLFAALALHAEPIGMEQCVKDALKNHPDVRAKLLQADQAQEGIRTQKSAYLPQVSLYAEYDLQRTYVMPNPLTESFRTVDDDGFSAGASLRQKIYDFSKTSSKISAAKTRRDIALLGAKQLRALMRYKVQNAYLLAVVQFEAIQSRLKDTEAKKALYEQAKALVAQGLKTRADESRFLSALRQAQDGLAQAESAYRKAVHLLEELTGDSIDPDTAEWNGRILQTDDPRPSCDPDVTVGQNLAVQIAQQEIKSADADYRAARSERFGSLDIVADASYFDTLSSYNSTFVGIRYSVPLYSGGRLQAQAQQAKIARQIAAERLESSKRQIRREILDLLSDIQEADKRIEARESQLEVARQTRELIEARYKEGMATYMEVLDAQADELDARLGLLAARYAKRERIFYLEYLNAQ